MKAKNKLSLNFFSSLYWLPLGRWITFFFVNLSHYYYYCILFITHQVCRPFLKTIKQLMLPIKSELEFCVLQLQHSEERGYVCLTWLFRSVRCSIAPKFNTRICQAAHTTAQHSTVEWDNFELSATLTVSHRFIALHRCVLLYTNASVFVSKVCACMGACGGNAVVSILVLY